MHLLFLFFAWAATLEEKISYLLEQKIQPQEDAAIKLISPLPADEGQDITLESFSGDQRFIIATFQTDKGNRFLVRGKLMSYVDIPVLLHPVRAGEEIEETDLGWERVEEDKVNRQTALDPSQIVGATPRYGVLMPHQPLKLSSFENKKVVKKGEMLTATYDHNGVSLSMDVKALETGSKGQLIRCKNLDSQKNLKVRIQDSGQGEIP